MYPYGVVFKADISGNRDQYPAIQKTEIMKRNIRIC